MLETTSSVVSELLRHHKQNLSTDAKNPHILGHLGRTCQETQFRVLPVWAQHPPPGSLREKNSLGGWRYFLWKRVVSVLDISTHPNPPLERAQKFFPHLEKWEAWATRASENHLSTSRSASNCAPANTESPDVKLQYRARSFLILDPWPSPCHPQLSDYSS